MFQVKEFINVQEDQESQDTKINKWLEENASTISIVDIKYSVGTFQANEEAGIGVQAYSGVLIVYKYKGNCDTDKLQLKLR